MATQAEIDAIKRNIATLNAALATGVRSVTIGGQTVIYNTTESLIKARNDAVAQLGVLMGGTGRPRAYYAYLSGRGYNR